MLHPDGQYEPGLIPQMVAPILDGEADLVLGSRLLIPGAALPPACRAGSTSRTVSSPPIQNRIMGTPLSEAPHRLSRLLAGAAAHGPIPAQLARLQLRLRAAAAGSPLRLPHRGGPCALPLLRGRLVGRIQDRCRLRAEDALGRRATAPAPPQHRARRASTSADQRVLGENELHDPQPALAPPATVRSRNRRLISLSATCCTFAIPVGTSVARLDERRRRSGRALARRGSRDSLQARLVDQHPSPASSSATASRTASMC